MDLRAMLNDSSDKKEKDAPKQPPRLFTSQSSYAERTPSYDGRPSHPQSAYAADSRSAGSGGGYFPAPSPSPAQHHSASTSTPSAGTHSASTYAQSPGPHGHYNALRENSTPQSAHPPSYITPPSAAHPSYPTTPGSAYPHHQPQQTPLYGTPYSSQPPLQQRPQTREGSVTTNGAPPQQVQPPQMSPPSHYHQAPSTPLGPPTVYPRPSPYAQRPSSQGYDNYRRSSVSSVGSAHSRDYTAHPMPHPAAARDGSVQRSYSGDEGLQRDRERSYESVSPKTIPRPTPQRQSTGSYSQEPTPVPPLNYQSPAPPPSGPPHHNYPPQSSFSSDRQPEILQAPPMYQNSLPPGPSESRAQSTYSARPTPEARTNSSMTPQSTHSSLPAQPSPVVKKEPQPQSSLKRNASVISIAPASVMPPKKRLKRDEIPIWARTARGTDCKRVRFDSTPPDARPSRHDRPVKHESVVMADMPHQAPPNGQPQPQQPVASNKWEDSILNNIPHEDLIRSVCDWIYLQIGKRQPPLGAAFEIEAKIGNIIDTREQGRLRLPVKTETIFDKDTYWAQTKFESTMDMQQHKFINDWLNKITHDSFREAHSTNPNRECLRSQHTVEVDDFFDLSPQGVQELDTAYHQYLPRGRTPRVRRTSNRRTGELTACIIKSRIADLEVYNPAYVFDYRISINLEAPWTGSMQHLSRVQDVGTQDREKDRVSYRHLAYQIDLTQISHMGSERKEHELEVEISVEETKKEIENLLNQRESRYEQLVHGFINNVRILCREGSKAR